MGITNLEGALAVGSGRPRLFEPRKRLAGAAWGFERGTPGGPCFTFSIHRNHTVSPSLNRAGRDRRDTKAAGRGRRQSPLRRPHSLGLINRSINSSFDRNRAGTRPLKDVGRKLGSKSRKRSAGAVGKDIRP
jgi:hypothetical protein